MITRLHCRGVARPPGLGPGGPGPPCQNFGGAGGHVIVWGACCRNLRGEASEEVIWKSGKVLRKQCNIIVRKNVLPTKGGDLKCCGPENFLAPHGFFWPSLTKNPGYTSVALISKELDLVPKYHIVEPT